MHKINEDVAQLLGEERMQRLAYLARLHRAWADMLGPMLAAATEPAEVRVQPDGSMHLIIAVNHPMIAQQIVFLRDEIRRACMQHCRLDRIAKIFTRIKPYAGVLPVEGPARQPAHVSLSQKKKLAADLHTIDDHALRLAMFQARVAQLMWLS